MTGAGWAFAGSQGLAFQNFGLFPPALAHWTVSVIVPTVALVVPEAPAIVIV
jgi:hypothetical protein